MWLRARSNRVVTRIADLFRWRSRREKKKTMDDERAREKKNNDDGQQERDGTRVRCPAVGRRELRMPTV
jgi:hypothetical protein